MKYQRIYNFSSGPAMMPTPVLEEIRDEVLNYKGTGMSVMELSHRSEIYYEIARQTENDLRKLLSVPEQYTVLFMQGGGTLQFSAVPANLMRNGRAVYIDTGVWSRKAAAEAVRYGRVEVLASGDGREHSAIPDCSNLNLPDDMDYVYICENETVNGNTWPALPNTKGHILVADQSSMFLSKPCTVTDYGLIFAGVQKNVGPAGMAIVIVRNDLIREDISEHVPLYLRYSIQAGAHSGYNTPNTWSVYCCGKTIRYLLEGGGLAEVHKCNVKKATILYDYLDSSLLFKSSVKKEFRSLMNVPFTTGDPQLDAEVVRQGERAGLYGLSGHPSVGGLRASLYNAMPKEGVEALVGFLQRFEVAYKREDEVRGNALVYK